MTSLPLGGVFYRSESLPISAQEAVNFYLNKPQAQSVTTENLFPTPGIPEATTAGTNVTNRGGHVFQGVPYVVNGTDLYRIDRTTDAFGVDSYASVKVNGAVPIPGSGRVVMEDNGAEGGQICIIIPGATNQFNAYIFTISGGLVQISDVDFNGPVDSLNYVDGFFLFTKQASQQIFVSALRNGLAYSATDNTDAESDPDSVVAAAILNNEPVVFGSETMETFQNIGGAGFPFQRVNGSVQQKGLDSKFAVTEVNDFLVFLGGARQETPAIWITDGGKPAKLSTTAIDNEISRYTDTVISTCFVWKYSQAGAQFVGFTFPTQATFVYDFTSKEWHTRESVDDADTIVPYRVSSVMEAYGVLLVGDTITTSIGILDRDTFTELGKIMRRRFVTPQFDNEGQPFWIDSLTLWGEHGTGLTSGQGSDPQVMMSFSDNGGRSFNNKISRSFGKIGEFNISSIWNSLGRISRQVCFKFEVSDPCKWVFAKVEAEIE